MSGIAVISIIVAVVLVSIVAIYINQAKERAKVERLQKITSLNDTLSPGEKRKSGRKNDGWN